MTRTLEEVADFLRMKYGTAATCLEPLGSGYWSSAYGFVLGGRRLVLRFGAHREDFERDREAVGYSGPDLPVPEVLEVGEDAGDAYAVSVRCDGSFLESLPPSESTWLAPALWRLLDALREVEIDPSQVSFDDPDGPSQKWRDFLAAPVNRPGRVNGWWARVQRDPAVLELFTRTRRTIDALAEDGGAPELRHLLHLDLLNRNVLVDQQRREVAAVFDWGCRAFGDFVYEIAAVSFFSTWHDGIAALSLADAAPSHFAALGLDVPRYETRLRCGELHVGLIHIAFSAFTGVEADLAAVCARTAALLASPLP